MPSEPHPPTEAERAERSEFLVQGRRVEGDEFAGFLEAQGIDLVEFIGGNIAVLRMSEGERTALAQEFDDLVIEPNAPLIRL